MRGIDLQYIDTLDTKHSSDLPKVTLFESGRARIYIKVNIQTLETSVTRVTLKLMSDLATLFSHGSFQ